MGVSVLILGHSGAGKSTSLRNFEDGEVGIFNVSGKPLPFRKKLPTVGKLQSTYGTIMATMRKNNLRAYVVDDANYLMAFQNFAHAKEAGYSKFTDMAYNFEQLLEAANATDDDTVVYFFMHPDYDDLGRMKAKTIGKMLDNQITIEGMFPIVLLAERTDGGYVFRVSGDSSTPVKAPMGMFDDGVTEIPNDLRALDATIREYWGMAPLGGD